MSKAIICNKYHYCLHLCQGYGQLEEQIDKFVQMKLSLDFYYLNCEGQNIAVSVCNICVFKMCPPVECGSLAFFKLVLSYLPRG